MESLQTSIQKMVCAATTSGHLTSMNVETCGSDLPVALRNMTATVFRTMTFIPGRAAIPSRVCTTTLPIICGLDLRSVALLNLTANDLRITLKMIKWENGCTR